jgi:hypothetical protein
LFKGDSPLGAEGDNEDVEEPFGSAADTARFPPVAPLGPADGNVPPGLDPVDVLLGSAFEVAWGRASTTPDRLLCSGRGIGTAISMPMIMAVAASLRLRRP